MSVSPPVDYARATSFTCLLAHRSVLTYMVVSCLLIDCQRPQSVLEICSMRLVSLHSIFSESLLHESTIRLVKK